jgi:taurine dioxygenase
MTISDLRVTPIGGNLGAELAGIDLRSELTDDDIEAIRAAMVEHMVVFLPDQHLDRDGHVAFGRRFGELEVFHAQAESGQVDAAESHPELLSLRSEAGLIADVWHTDVTWTESPPLASIVQMVEMPAKGGDTMWSNQVSAFAGLTPPIRELLLGLTAVHTGAPLGLPDRRAVHPVVRAHPDTGEPCLYVNRQFTSHIVELSPAESDTLLPFLLDWCEQPQFTCRYHWTEGTVAMWDNRVTQHYVVNDFDEPRTLERVTVVGDHPEAAGEARWPAFASAGVAASASPAILRG